MTSTLLWYVPGLPTTKRMSAISSLLNIAAFLSLTVGLEACQLGSMVDWPGQVKLKDVLVKLGDARGDVGALAGCVICIVSRWEMLWGGDRDRPPLLGVSAATKEQWTWKYTIITTIIIFLLSTLDMLYRSVTLNLNNMMSVCVPLDKGGGGGMILTGEYIEGWPK
jgi:hypothetical protein